MKIRNQEGIPNSILEAMATGLPVLATRHGGIPEAVISGRTGFLVKERDYFALAAEMKKITQSRHSFREMGALASESVAANFEQGAQIRQLESYYEEAASIAAELDVEERTRESVLRAGFPAQVSAE